MNITQIFNEMKFDADKCGECEHLAITTDAYATGDSQASFECLLSSVHADNCWLAVREFENLKEQEDGLQ